MKKSAPTVMAPAGDEEARDREGEPVIAPGDRAPTPPLPSATRARTASEDDRLVFDAMRALRQDGQPERASRSLDEYLRRHPEGQLAEEALALSIEAASARNDPRAKDLASRYLAKYPNGRFRSAAERARARFAQ